MARSRPRCRLVLVLAAGICLAIVAGQKAGYTQGGEPDYEPVGLQPHRAYYSQAPFEAVDMANGNLLLTFTDLVLPGDAGMDLRFVRTYSHASSPKWTFGLGGIPIRIAYPDGPYSPEHEFEWPQLITADGSIHQTAPVEWSWPPDFSPDDEYVTAEFWRYTPGARRVDLPNGWVATYEHSTPPRPGGDMLLAVEDQHGNRIDVDWLPDSIAPLALDQVRQTVSGAVRVVDFTHDERSGVMPKTMEFDGRVWTYFYDQEIPYRGWLLTEVQPPAGPAWAYSYGDWVYSTYRSVAVTTPADGVVTYQFDDQELPDYEGVPRPVVRTRTTSGNLPLGTWTFSYEQAGFGTGRVEMPGNLTLDFAQETGGDLGSPSLGPSWFVSDKRLFEDGSEIASVHYEYRSLGVTEYRDIKVLERQTITRDGASYTTSFSYSEDDFGDYHHPNRMEEFSDDYGEEKRVTTRSYRHNFPGYILGALAGETVNGHGRSWDRSFTYDDVGFLITSTIDGITKTFAPDARGNVGTETIVVDGQGHTTTFTYQFGTLKDIVPPEPYTGVTRVINPDGTVASETRRSAATMSFQYDGLGREILRTPPEGHPIETDYESDPDSHCQPTNGLVKVSRGNAWTCTYLDAFGRRTSTLNAEGVRTGIEYDALGRKTYESYPYDAGTAEVGTHFKYDGLGRVTEAKTADNKTVLYEYGYDTEGLQTTINITDQNGHTTVQHWKAWGDPNAAVLVGVADPEGNPSTYQYDAIGNLLSATVTSGGTRTWEYYPGTSLVWEEIHPESGTATYEYDEAGNLHTRSDARATLVYGYDGNNRLTSIDGPNDQDLDVTYDDEDNVRTVEAGPPSLRVVTEFSYDRADRLTKRTDAVDGRTFVSEYGYDDRDNLVDVYYPYESGSTRRRHVRYGYDNADRVDRVDQLEPIVRRYADQISYHPSGALLGYTAGNGVQHTFEYDDERYWPTLVRASKGGTDLLNLDYGYGDGEDQDFVGNVMSITDAVDPGHSTSFLYDSLDRLTDADGPWGYLDFDHDAAGNRLTRRLNGVTTQYLYDPQTRRLTSTTGGEAESFTYYSSGDLESDRFATQYSYTPFGMLAQVNRAGIAWTFRYDGDNQRILRQATGKSFYTLRGPAGVLSEFIQDASGPMTWERDYIYLGSRVIASVKALKTLSVQRNGSGTVTSEPGGIDCGESCTAGFGEGTNVTLTALEGATTTLEEWGGDCVHGQTNATVNVLMEANRNCTADFVAGKRLRVQIDPPGAGFVTAPNINCPAGACTSVYTLNQQVTLTASQNQGYAFTGWSGACSGTVNQATVMMSVDKTCTAHFLPTYVLTVSRSGTGSGTVTGPGINCGADCAETFLSGTAVSLSVAPVSGSVFAGWTGAPDCFDGAVTMAGPRTCNAIFMTVLPEPPGPGPGSLDLNGDRGADVLTYDVATGSRAWRFTDRAGQFGTLTGPAWEANWTIKGGDFNGDGRSDLFFYNSATGMWYKAFAYGNGNFGFAAGSGPWAAGWQVYILDLNGDGRSDVFVYNPTYGYWSECITNPLSPAGEFFYSGGQWDPGWEIYPARLWPHASALQTDLFLYKPATGQWYRVIGSEQQVPVFSYYYGTWSPDWKVYPGDLNADGLTDMFVYNLTVGYWYQCYSIANGTNFSYSSLGSWSPGWISLTVGDFNGDGRADVMTYNPLVYSPPAQNLPTGAWFECWNNGAGGFGCTPGGQTWDPGWAIWPLDYDRDGKSDLLFYRATDVAGFAGGWWVAARKGTTPALGVFTFTNGTWEQNLTIIATRTRVP